MKLDYNILWLDNDIKDYKENGDVESIEDFLIDLGFEPNIVTVSDEAEINKHLVGISYDLIISDFNLNEKNGDVVIYELREKNKLDTEILFYSARGDFTNVKEVKERLAFMERINIHTRDNLLSKIEKVIRLTVGKLLELNATRGLITAITSELDVEIETLSIAILRNHLKKSDDELNGIVQFYVDDFLTEESKRFMKKHQNVGFDSSFKLIQASRKWGIFRESLEELSKQNSAEEIRNFLEFNRTYSDDVINVRNKFAHAKAEKKDNKMVLKGQDKGQNFEFDTEKCVEIRKKLIGHKREIEKLKIFLDSNF